MKQEELNEIKSMALGYGDPLRGKVLALIATVEDLQDKQKSGIVVKPGSMLAIDSTSKISVGETYAHIQTKETNVTVAIELSIIKETYKMYEERKRSQ